MKRRYEWVNIFWRGILPLVAYACIGGALPARAQVSVVAVIEPSPMIKKGHLEGGINGEGTRRKDGKTPLMLAIENHQVDVIDYLLSQGADLSLKDAAGDTAMDIARKMGTGDLAIKLDAYLTAHPDCAVYYAGRVPTLSIVSGNNQSGSPNCDALRSLVVSVTDKDGHPMANAPVQFVVENNKAHIMTGPSSPDSSTLLVRTGDDGQCSVNLHLPGIPLSHIHIIARAGYGDNISTVTFNAMTNDASAGDSTPYWELRNLIGQVASDGGVDVTWDNPTNDASCIKVWVDKSGGAYTLFKTLPPDATSVHVPPWW
jgi:hypothetical protein